MLRSQMICFLGMALAGAGICQSERFLDLTKLAYPKSAYGGSIGGILGDQGPPKASPLRITLLSLDKETYYWGEKFVADARVENLGDQPLAFPATLGNPEVSRTAVAAWIEPVADPDPARAKKAITDGRMPSNFLHGSTDGPKSVIMIQPRETLRIRFASQVSPEAQSHDRFPFQLAVKVRVSFSQGPLSNNYSPAISENSITVTVEAKP